MCARSGSGQGAETDAVRAASELKHAVVGKYHGSFFDKAHKYLDIEIL
jgi:hypothetical protein